MDGQPWHFNNHAIILGDIEGNKKPFDMEIFHLPMWIRVYNLLFKGRFNIMNVEAIGNKLGNFIKFDISGSVGIDKSIRIRVNVDMCKPLIKNVKVKLRGGVEELFDVKYERPPIFCFFCGRLGYGVKDCHECGDEEEPPLEFGGWLKAPQWKRSLINEDKRGQDGRLGRARSVFITKPKAVEVQAVHKQVEEVIDNLHSCGLREVHREMVKETKNT